MRTLRGPAKAGLYALLSLAVPAAAHAQARRPAQPPMPWTEHARISINFGILQPASTTFTGTTTQTVYLETATVNTAYGVPRGPSVDGGVLIRVAGAFGVGIAISSFKNSAAATVTGSIPHPFFLNTPRPLSGTTSPLERSETAMHIQAAYARSSGRLDVAIAGGPTLFTVSQDLIADAPYTETYPYDSVTFTGTTSSKVTQTEVGFNAGVDVGMKLSESLGVGGLIRFSRATVVLPLAGTPSGVSTTLGGLYAGGGIRFYF